MVALSGLLCAAARALTGDAPLNEDAGDLLGQLDYLDSAPEEKPHRAAMLRVAAGFARLFTLTNPDAPGLVVVGAEVDPSVLGLHREPLGNVSGTGTTFRQAFESCVGEAAEHLSRYATDEDRLETWPADAALADASPALRDLVGLLGPYRRNPAAATMAWIVAADMADGRAVRLPADMCVRRPPEMRDFDVPWPLSTGCGAAADHLRATLHGLLELIERDAVALWWRGGHRGRVTYSASGIALLRRLRAGVDRRQTWFLDVTCDTGVPVVVAASCRHDGFGLCLGSAARTTLDEAAEAAAREMAQMELGLQLAEAKRAHRGDAGLQEADRRHLRRATMLEVAATPALQPVAPPARSRDLAAADPGAALMEVRARLAAIGLAPSALNLTKQALGVPVVRVVCPGLEPGLESPPGPRLRALAARNGVDPIAAGPL